MTISDRVKYTRIALGYSCQEVADATEISLTHVQNIENGTIPVWDKAAVKLSHVLDIPIGYFGLEAPPDSFQYKLLEFRTLNDLTRKELAEMLGVKLVNLSSWENGTRPCLKKGGDCAKATK